MSNDKRGGSLLAFFVGLLLLGAGLFMIANQVSVTSSFGYFRLGGVSVPFGLTTVPLIIGIIWLFVKPDMVLPKIVIVLGVLFIIVSIIMSVRLHFVRTSLYEYILMFGMTAAGTGLILRTLFAPKNKSRKDDQNKK
ncbi:hypothetical protein [uncultured Flavonifractor sp.]|uniref:hypothetical protein n=1 Tax=uncultured Flavonifractor sp. TaxID=1193534 RepID=UPI00261C58FC|nr:hypothetical protein [uncultured Flavonifractor sp.]